MPLHEWSYKVTDEQSNEEENIQKEPTEDIITWIFEAGTFIPTAKMLDNKQYSIVSDYLGTPIQMYDGQGNKTWDCLLDIYGKVTTFDGGSEFDCPFRFQGQYADKETELYYNRFRYYFPKAGCYLSLDPIGLLGNNPTLYGYVNNPNLQFDLLGWDVIRLRHYTSRKGFEGIQKEMMIKAGDQNAVFATKAKGKPLSMSDAAEKFKIKENHARDYIDFNIDDSCVKFRKNDLGVEEYKIKGDVKLDPKTTKFVKRCH